MSGLPAMPNKFVVVEDNGTGEVLVLSVEQADEYNQPNCIHHTGYNCERGEYGYSRQEAQELATQLRVRGR
jgi:hypothetical protein